ncbi:MAG: Fe-S protein assembly co-chaperone HscB [Pseudomonadota bacterium]
MPDTANYFELFQLPVTFDINFDNLTQRYHILQKASHPDRHTQSVGTAQQLALQHTITINEAYQTLKDPLQRAIYLLSLQGISLDETNGVQDSAFLMEQMTLREELAGIPQQPDPPAASNHLQQTIQTLITTQLANLATWFTNPGEPQIACTAVHKLQFLYKLKQEATTVTTHLNAS